MSDFIVEKLTKTVGDKTVFKNISFIIHGLDRIGLIGVNGTGKTTLLNVLSGKSGFDGDINPFSAHSDYKIGYLTQDPHFDDDRTVLDTVLSSTLREIQLIREYELLLSNYDENNQSRLEKVMAEMDALQAWEIESQVKTVLSKLGLDDLSAKVGDLSGGLRRRVQLAQVLLGDDDLLLLDEPTNHLDIDSIEWLTNFLKNSKKTVLFITHDRYFLDSVSTRIFELDSGSLVEYQGNYQDYVRLKAEQDERDAALLHKKQQLYKQELSWMRRQPQARATKQQARINRFHDLKQDLAGQATDSSLEMNFETSRIGKKVIEFKDIDFAYGDKKILSHFNLLVQNKDRIGIVGDNGVGKSTLLKIIDGSLVPTAGHVNIGKTVKFAVLSQRLDELEKLGKYRVKEVLSRYKPSYIVDGKETTPGQLMERLGFSAAQLMTPIADLSGGQKRRMQLLLILLDEPNVLIMDEPGNDLDTDMLTIMEDLLDTWPGTLIVVSHDAYLLERVTDHQFAIFDGKIRHLPGGVDDYFALLEGKEIVDNPISGGIVSTGNESVLTSAGVQTQSSHTADDKAARIAKREASKRMSAIERKIAKLQDEQKQLEEQMAAHNPSDFVGLNEINMQVEAVRSRIDELEMEWLEKSEIVEG